MDFVVLLLHLTILSRPWRCHVLVEMQPCPTEEGHVAEQVPCVFSHAARLLRQGCGQVWPLPLHAHCSIVYLQASPSEELTTQPPSEQAFLPALSLETFVVQCQLVVPKRFFAQAWLAVPCNDSANFPSEILLIRVAVQRWDRVPCSKSESQSMKHCEWRHAAANFLPNRRWQLAPSAMSKRCELLPRPLALVLSPFASVWLPTAKLCLVGTRLVHLLLKASCLEVARGASSATANGRSPNLCDLGVGQVSLASH